MIKALNNTSNNIVSYYCIHYDNAEDKYLPYQNSIGKLIDCIESGTRFSGFEDEMKIRIEITESFNVTAMNIMGDIAGFVPMQK